MNDWHSIPAPARAAPSAVAMPSQPFSPETASPVTPTVRDRDPRRRRKVSRQEFQQWLTDRVPGIAAEWSEELRLRGLGQGEAVDRVVRRFVEDLTGMLPYLLGPRGEQLRAIWIRACELFGTMAAKRGLAAGEVIEEFQVLRELVIRELYREPPGGGLLSLREVLRLNRIVDWGVTHSSVGHTDAMFFQLFESRDETVAAEPVDVAEEVQAQLALIRAEVAEIVGAPGSGVSVSGLGH